MNNESKKVASKGNESKEGFFQDQKNIIFSAIILVLIIILLILLLNRGDKKEEMKPGKAETEQMQPESRETKETEASKDLEKEIEGLSSRSKTESSTSKQSTTRESSKQKSSKIEGSVFNYEGKPNLSFVKYDFGIYLTPVTQGSDTYVPIKFISKEYIRKLAPEVSGLEENSVPMTDMANPKGRPAGKEWRLDQSGTVYYFVDFGQKVKKSEGSTAEIPLNAYAGQKPGGHQIWLMYEAAVLNKVGFTQYWNNGNFVSNGDGGYDYAGYFEGYIRH